MKRKFHLIFALFICALTAAGQVREDISRKGMVYLMPEASFWFGTYTSVDVAPQVGYHLSDRWSIGAGGHYTFFKNANYYGNFDWSTHIFGVKAFTRFDIIRHAEEFLPFYLFNDLFMHIEYEAMSLESKYFSAPLFPEEGRFWNHNLFLGAGISQQMGQYSSYYMMILWNLNNSYYTPYSNPSYRVGLTIYLSRPEKKISF